MNRTIRKVAVLGSGIMGSGIACQLANVGIEVLLMDMIPKEAEDSKNKLHRNQLVNQALKNAIKSKPAPLYSNKMIKNITFDEFRIRDNREFFRMSPEQAKAALDIAEGEDVTPREDVVETTSDKTALDKERNRNRFNFAQIGIEVGEELEFKKDKTIKAKVLENDLIEYKGRPMSLSQSALEIVQEMGYTWNKIAGPQFWMYKGKTLYELNNQ